MFQAPRGPQITARLGTDTPVSALWSEGAS